MRSPGASTRAACTSSSTAPLTGASAVYRWLAREPLYIAHRGGDASWVEGTAAAYQLATAWNPDLALEVPVRRTADGVWVVSEDPSTSRVFGVDDIIATSRWATLSALRTMTGHLPMARLVADVLARVGPSRVVFVDDKDNNHVASLFKTLDSYGGIGRFVIKTYYNSNVVAAGAHALGYLTWGYYYQADMKRFAATQARFDLLGLSQSAPRSDYRTMAATGKPVIAFIVGSSDSAKKALCLGASGLMVSAVRAVVPH